MVEVDESSDMPLVVVIDDVDAPNGAWLGELEYEELDRKGSPEFVPVEVDDEWDFGRRSFEAPMAAEREREKEDVGGERESGERETFLNFFIFK